MFIVDGHCDTLLKLFKNNESFWEEEINGHVNWRRLQKGKVALQFMAIYIEPEYKRAGPLKRALEILDYFYHLQQAGKGKPLLVIKKEDLQKLKKEQPSVLLAIEGGEALEGNLAVLRILFKLGIRSLTLTWNQRNELADGIWEEKTAGGLTSFGCQVVKEMNQLGMLIDVSHLSEKGFWDVLKFTQQPLAATHSACYALRAHPRNLRDEQLTALAQNQGIIGLNFYPLFLGSQSQVISFRNVIEHLEHAVSITGIDHVGLGSDFDGIAQVPLGLEDATKFPVIIEELLRLGWPESDVKKIMGGNFLRVLQQVLPD